MQYCNIMYCTITAGVHETITQKDYIFGTHIIELQRTYKFIADDEVNTGRREEKA